MATCLLPNQIEKIKKDFKDKEETFRPSDYLNLDGTQITEKLKPIVGENAEALSKLIQEKLVLKNRIRGVELLRDKLNQKGKYSPGRVTKAKEDIALYKQKNMERIMSPKEHESFLSTLAGRVAGTDLTREQAKTVFDMSKKAEELKANIENGGDRLDYGAAKVEVINYIKELKTEANKTSLVEKLKPKNWGEDISGIAGIAKSLKASFDDSAIFRQGWKTLWTNPKTWYKNALISFKDIVNTLKGEDTISAVQADIVSRPNYDRMVEANLATGVTEEAYPSNLPEKVPILGRIYKSSEAAYTGFVYRMRADVFDSYIDIAEKSGIDINDKTQLKSIGNLVNSLTGRGNLGKFENAANTINNVFFSPRMVKSSVDFLTAHQFQKDVTPFVRKQAAINLVKVVAGTAAILSIASAMNKKSVEWDPRSADFGKIKIDDTRFDVSGGMSATVILAARLIMGSQKSSTTGKVSKLDTGKFGAPTSQDVIVNFFTNKLSPIASVIKDIKTGVDYQGNKITALGEIRNLFEPLPITTAIELYQNDKAANKLLGILADELGIAVNTYSPKKKK